MPRRLNRPNYGWSYTYAKDMRTPTDKFKENFDKIKWNNADLSELPTRKNRFGVAKVKVFDNA